MLKPSKCHFFRKQVEFLGHIVSQKGVETDPKKILDMIQDYRAIAKPLYELTGKNTSFVWTIARNNAFEKLKSALTSA